MLNIFYKIPYLKLYQRNYTRTVNFNIFCLIINMTLNINHHAAVIFSYHSQHITNKT